MNKNILRAQKPLPAAWHKISRVCEALGDVQRQRILLAFAPDEKLSIRHIVESSPLSRTAITHHLHVMRDAGVLHSVKVGKEMLFWVDKDFVRECLSHVIAYIDESL